MHWIIDGYNVIRQVDFLAEEETKSLRSGREALLNLLSRFFKVRLKGKGRITVVFDGPEGVFIPFSVGSRDIRVLFSRGGSADQVIQECVNQSVNPGDTTVVSADREVFTFARRKGCATIAPDDFIEYALYPDKPSEPKPTLPADQMLKIEDELRHRLAFDKNVPVKGTILDLKGVMKGSSTGQIDFDELRENVKEKVGKESAEETK
ncbi:MAG: hypothetical protein COX46_03120 [bacterium (Candidatus Ratteibacteria) CG23_combo_of_CG06-09_8_20_14_all_48_7]|uniref:RNA-binding protein n=1 Tax=bacterium (Candidatus Ratteibacteria) CG23_combo_of_CG06-09_8_20_14_all_48_7 TaxID=2014292 RepID=A0A2G9YAP7_9BACT|nr:MAG: hypothetical protein COX46_03120 [bacterium (Candidatus Ratteibacteria) CG23_combo_of_CG06-09_8_20_14_all_48_7]